MRFFLTSLTPALMAVVALANTCAAVASYNSMTDPAGRSVVAEIEKQLAKP